MKSTLFCILLSLTYSHHLLGQALPNACIVAIKELAQKRNIQSKKDLLKHLNFYDNTHVYQCQGFDYLVGWEKKESHLKEFCLNISYQEKEDENNWWIRIVTDVYTDWNWINMDESDPKAKYTDRYGTKYHQWHRKKTTMLGADKTGINIYKFRLQSDGKFNSYMRKGHLGIERLNKSKGKCQKIDADLMRDEINKYF